MLYPIPAHPYPAGTRVHHAAEQDPSVCAAGTAVVLGAESLSNGRFSYRVRRDDGQEHQWPSFFTIPVETAPPPPPVPEPEVAREPEAVPEADADRTRRHGSNEGDGTADALMTAEAPTAERDDQASEAPAT